MSKQRPESLEVAERILEEHARRGIFRRFGVRRQGSRGEYRFLWLAPRPHRLVVDAARRRLVFPDLLPNVPYPSAMDRELRAFLRRRVTDEVPAHRRIDPQRASLEVRNHGGSISIALRAAPGELGYATRKLIKVVNEVFFLFLSGPYERYMVENFDAPEE